MGFLSSLFGFGDKPASETTVRASQVPEVMKPYVEEVLRDTQGLYQQRLAEGYQPYTEQTIAPFSPEEIASQEGLKSLIGTQTPLQEEALGLIRGTTQKFTPEVAEEYMSPYIRAVIDTEKAEAQRQFERTKVPEFEAQAVAAGGMSGLGTRATVESTLRAGEQNRLLAEIEAKGQQKAYEDAQRLFQDQLQRESGVASQLSTAAPNIFKSGLAEQGILQQIGEQKRDLTQSALDEAYLKYIEEDQFPETQLARYQTSIYGNPLLKQPSFTQTGQTVGGTPQLGKTLLGMGTTALGFGTGGGSTIGGNIFSKFFPTKAGGGQIGGLASMPQALPYINYMRRNMGGQVVPPVVYRQDKGQVYGRGGSELPSRETIHPDERLLKLLKNRPSPLVSPFKLPEPISPTRGSGAEPTSSVQAVSLSKPVKIDRPEVSVTDESHLLGPVITGSKEKWEKEGIQVPDFIGGGDHTSVSKDVAANTELKTKLDILTQNKDNTNVIETIRKAFKNYDAKMRPLLDQNPFEKQKFWATIGAEIMKPGNAFANMVTGFKKAVDSLDADADTKRKLEAAILGKELETEIGIGALETKIKLAELDTWAKLRTAFAKATGTLKKDIRKRMHEVRKIALQNILKTDAADIKTSLNKYVKTLDDGGSKTVLEGKIEEMKPATIKDHLAEIMSSDLKVGSAIDAYKVLLGRL